MQSLLLVLRMVRNTGTRIEVLIWWRELWLQGIEVSDVPRVISSYLTSSLLLIMRQVLRQHRAVETTEAVAQRHIVRKILPSFVCRWREEFNNAVLLAPASWSFDGCQLGNIRS